MQVGSSGSSRVIGWLADGYTRGYIGATWGVDRYRYRGGVALSAAIVDGSGGVAVGTCC